MYRRRRSTDVSLSVYPRVNEKEGGYSGRVPSYSLLKVANKKPTAYKNRNFMLIIQHQDCLTSSRGRARTQPGGVVGSCLSNNSPRWSERPFCVCAGMVQIVLYLMSMDADMSAEPMPYNCRRIVVLRFQAMHHHGDVT